MIRRSILEQCRIGTYNTITDFVNLAIENQANPNDILLILTCGQYDSEHASNSNSELSGYVVGHLFERFSNKTSQEFLKWHFNDSGFVIEGELPKVDISAGAEHHVAITIESMIYLSFWESEMTLMILYQLSRLSNGEPYDWHWRNKLDGTRSRNEFFRKRIKNKIKEQTEFYELLDSIAISQIRNAIAHSQLAPLNNKIKLLNYSPDPKKYSPLNLISYEYWEKLICSTIAFRGALISILNDISRTASNQFESGKFNVTIETPEGSIRGSFPL